MTNNGASVCTFIRYTHCGSVHWTFSNLLFFFFCLSFFCAVCTNTRLCRFHFVVSLCASFCCYFFFVCVVSSRCLSLHFNGEFSARLAFVLTRYTSTTNGFYGYIIFAECAVEASRKFVVNINDIVGYTCICNWTCVSMQSY